MDFIVELCQVITTVALPLILLAFLIPPRFTLPLDRAFIWKQAGFCILISVYMTHRWFGWGGWTWRAAVVLSWVNVAIAELFVLYYIYQERFHPKVMSRLFMNRRYNHRSRHADSRQSHPGRQS